MGSIVVDGITFLIARSFFFPGVELGVCESGVCVIEETRKRESEQYCGRRHHILDRALLFFASAEWGVCESGV